MAISIHAPREGSDAVGWILSACRLKFQSTLPARGATFSRFYLDGYYSISIHAPREGSDGQRRGYRTHSRHISIHAPREGSDGSRWCCCVRGCDFNPRSPRGERHRQESARVANDAISIHAPREGSDNKRARGIVQGQNFNPRSPRGERHPRIRHPAFGKLYFNPRSPRGERQGGSGRENRMLLFQSTLPARGATDSIGYRLADRPISIHAPREGSDYIETHRTILAAGISIHAPREGSDFL